MIVIKNIINNLFMSVLDRFNYLYYVYNINNLLYLFIINNIYIYINNEIFILNSNIKNIKINNLKNYFKNNIVKLNFIQYNNSVVGKTLILNGIEYKLTLKNNYLLLNLGYSHLIIIKLNKYNINYSVNNNRKINFIYNISYSTYINNLIYQIYKLKVLNKYKKKGFLYNL